MLHRKRAIGNGRPFLPKLFLILVSHTTVLWYTVVTLSVREEGTRNEKKRDVFRDEDVVFQSGYGRGSGS